MYVSTARCVTSLTGSSNCQVGAKSVNGYRKVAMGWKKIKNFEVACAWLVLKASLSRVEPCCDNKTGRGVEGANSRGDLQRN